MNRDLVSDERCPGLVRKTKGTQEIKENNMSERGTGAEMTHACSDTFSFLVINFVCGRFHKSKWSISQIQK